MTLLVTDRVTSRAITWPVDILPRLTLVPKIVPTIEPICPRIPPPAPAPPSAGAALDRALADDRLALLRRDRPDPRRRRPDHDALDHGRRAAAFEERHQRFALAEFHDDAGGIELRVRPEGLRRGIDRLLVAWREGAQRVLHATAQLSQHLVRHVDRILRDEINADALGADQADHLLDLVHQRLRRVVEQQMRLVEEEHQFRLRQVAGFRQLLKQLRQHPQQEGGVEPGTLHQFVCDQDVDHSPAVAVGLHEILQHERRLAEEFRCALIFQHQKLALDGSDGCLADIAEALRGLSELGLSSFELVHLGIRLFGIRPLSAAGWRDRIQQRPQILHVDQRQAVFVRHTECDVEDALLHVVQVEHPRQQQRAHLRHRSANRMALLAEHVPKHGRELVRLEFQAHLSGALEDEVLGLADLGDSGQVALDIGREHRNTGACKAFRHHLQRHGLAGSGRSGDKAMPIGKRKRKPGCLFALADENLLVGIGRLVIGSHHRIASSRASGRVGCQSYRILPAD
jgi:hypothetical protein